MDTYYGYFDCILQDPRAYVDLKRWASAALQSHNPQQETPLIKQVDTIMTSYVYIYYIYYDGNTWSDLVSPTCRHIRIPPVAKR